MAADLGQAVGALVDDLADLEIDEELLNRASDSDGDSEEAEAVQAAAPAPAPAAAANRGRGTSAKGAGAPGKGRGGKAWPAAAAAGAPLARSCTAAHHPPARARPLPDAPRQ